MAYKDYSDAQVTEVLIKLAVNKYDYGKTAAETGIAEKTLRRWDKDAPKKAIPDLLARAIERMLLVIPNTWTGTDWAITLGILMDKWLLIQGEPTNRTENLIRGLKDVDDGDREAIEREVERILSEAGSGGIDKSQPGSK